MSIERYPSKLLENAINEFARLPGIGRKSALRLVLHLLRQSGKSVTAFSESLVQLRNEVKYCSVCHNISDAEVCEICSNPSRNRSEICVVENIHDVMLIENTHQYNGLYHVLGGIISPMDGVGPGELEIDSLTERAGSSDVKEIIMALPTTMEGDTTSFYIFRKLKNKPVRITTLARGVAIGDDLEYTDEITLGRSLTNRVLYESSMGK